MQGVFRALNVVAFRVNTIAIGPSTILCTKRFGWPITARKYFDRPHTESKRPCQSGLSLVTRFDGFASMRYWLFQWTTNELVLC
jgi:hypothetical protein